MLRTACAHDNPVSLQALTFAATLVDPNVTALPLTGGAANAVVADFIVSGLNSTVTEIEPLMAFTDVAIFIDASRASMTRIARLKDWSVSYAPSCPQLESRCRYGSYSGLGRSPGQDHVLLSGCQWNASVQ